MKHTIGQAMAAEFVLVVSLLLFLFWASHQQAVKRTELEHRINDARGVQAQIASELLSSENRRLEAVRWTLTAKKQAEDRRLIQLTAAYNACNSGSDALFSILGTVILLSLVFVFVDVRHADRIRRQAHQKVENLLESITDGFFALSCDWKFTFINREAEYLLGRRREELIGRNIWEIFPDLVETEFYNQYYHATQEKLSACFEALSIRHGCWYEVHVYPFDEGLAVYLDDATERRSSAEALRRSEARLAEAQEVAHIGSWEYDVETWKFSWTDEMFHILNLDPVQGIPDYALLLTRYHPDDAPMHNQCVENAIAHAIPYEFDIRILESDGSIRWAHTIGKPICDDDGEVIRLVGTLMDVTEHKAAEMRLQEVNKRLADLATTDGLTGLKNHRTFQAQIKHEYERSVRYFEPLSLIMLDVDRFKQFNDAYGHPAGDAVLKKVAETLQSVARSTDVVARYGGEEFVIILPETNAERARAAAERFRAAIESAPWQEHPVTASFGVATLHSGVCDTATLLAEADAALYRSKRRGRNCVTHADDLPDRTEVETAAVKTYAVVLPPQPELKVHGLALVSDNPRSEALVHAYDATIESWSRILDMRDKETEGHSLRVTDMTVCLARSIGRSAEEVLYARWGALLHDIGKMGVPDSILLKPEPLTPEEWDVMRRHPILAYEMLSPVAFLRPALDIPYCHHEKWDGTGYPRKLKGEAIPLSARLFAVIDVYDALRSDRPYRAAWSEERVRAYLCEQSGTHFDPDAVKAFLTMLQEGESRRQSALVPNTL